jgi:hypothetical protein
MMSKPLPVSTPEKDLPAGDKAPLAVSFLIESYGQSGTMSNANIKNTG